MPFTLMELLSMSNPSTVALIKVLAISLLLGADVLTNETSMTLMIDPLLKKEKILYCLKYQI